MGVGKVSTDIPYFRELFEEQNKILERINKQLAQIITLLKKRTEEPTPERDWLTGDESD